MQSDWRKAGSGGLTSSVHLVFMGSGAICTEWICLAAIHLLFDDRAARIIPPNTNPKPVRNMPDRMLPKNRTDPAMPTNGTPKVKFDIA